MVKLNVAQAKLGSVPHRCIYNLKKYPSAELVRKEFWRSVMNVVICFGYDQYQFARVA